MKKILLVCSGGISTSFLVQRTVDAAAKQDKTIEIVARSINEVGEQINKFDCVLIAPQARLGEKRVKKICEKRDKKYFVIPHSVYGAMDGKVFLDYIESLKISEE